MTNFRGSFFDLNSPIWIDVLNGWSVEAGVAGAQAGTALDFYNTVKAKEPIRVTRASPPTGHSLGGGLAGYVPSLSAAPIAA